MDMMYEKLETKFNLLRLDRVFMEHVNDKLHRQWKRTCGTLSAYWMENGGITNPQQARSKVKADCRSKEDWNHLCDYWELESTQRYSDQMKVNRGKQVIASRGGSRSIANHVFHMENIIRHKDEADGKVNFRRYYYNIYHALQARRRGN
ncbi:hypothetical protein QVD17_08826 [Tagetes erecta]|uniref:Transposase n=1 Tax=Tagetes erecta TaxID=13708 RepID=A0AAD8KYB9_TARER|nr:hypothetical protein QVD17_08826 [Tagetes erecta]